VNAAELRRIIALICHHDVAGFSEFDEHDLEIGDLGRLWGDRHGGGRCRCDRLLVRIFDHRSSNVVVGHRCVTFPVITSTTGAAQHHQDSEQSKRTTAHRGTSVDEPVIRR